jgi:hypothetical protein
MDETTQFPNVFTTMLPSVRRDITHKVHKLYSLFMHCTQGRNFGITARGGGGGVSLFCQTTRA